MYVADYQGKSAKIKTIEIILTGRVQCVGLRYNTEIFANEIGLVGYIRNEPDKTVKVIVQGDEKLIKELVNWFKNSSPGKVNEIKVKEINTKKVFNEFLIKY